MGIQDLSIKIKLYAIFALAFVPIALLAWLFIAQSNKDIDFAVKEMDGSRYLAPMWELLHTTVAFSTHPLSGSDEVNKAAADLRAVQGIYVGEMGTAELASAAAKGLEAATTSNSTDDAVAAIGALRAVLSKAADGSNLTLDPDLDSYYVQDTTTVKMPEMIDQAATLLRMAQAYHGKESLTTAEKAAFLIHAGQFSGVVDGMTGDYTSAVGGNATGTVEANMKDAQGKLADAAKAYIDLVTAAGDHFANASPADVDLTKLAAAHTALQDAADVYWQAANLELQILLNTRMAGFNSKLYVNLAVVTVMCLAIWLAVYFVIRNILMNIDGLRTAFQAMAKLDLSVRTQAKSKDELGTTLSQLNSTAGQISDVIRSTQNASSSVSAATNELSSTMASIEDVMKRQTDVIDGIASAVQQTAQTASEVSQRATASTSSTEQAVVKIAETLTKVNQLQGSAHKIGEAREVIQGISEQINLLALNAAIEAARAGDAGRGFAVVADEVRKLAISTSQSTQEIAAMIKSLQENVVAASASLEEVSGALGHVKENANSVLSSVSEQTSAVNNINDNIIHFRDNMGTVATSVRESKIASDSIAQSAEELKNQTDKFRLPARA